MPWRRHCRTAIYSPVLSGPETRSRYALNVDPKRDMDERFNVEGDPEEVLAALLAVNPDDDPDDE